MARKTNFEVNGSSYYRVTATIGKDSEGFPIRKQFYGSSKKEAEAKRDEYLLNINKGLSVGYDKALFGKVFAVWFEEVLRPSVALSSYCRYEKDYRLRIKGCPFANMKLVDVKAINVQSFYNELLQTNSINTVINTNKLINHFFSYCVKSDLIVKNPMVAVELPKDKSVKEESAILSRVEIGLMVEAASCDINNFIFAFAIFTGLRQGEILALTHRDVDFVNDVIKVNKTLNHLSIDGQYRAVLSSTKTQSSVREVPILDEIKPLLKRHILNEKEKCLRLGIPFGGDCILFSSASCSYMEGSNLRKRLKRLYVRLGIKQTSFHVLRHTFCTLLAEMGVPLNTASRLMGHSDIGVTAKIYTHVDGVEMKKGIAKLSEVFKEV